MRLDPKPDRFLDDRIRRLEDDLERLYKERCGLPVVGGDGMRLKKYFWCVECGKDWADVERHIDGLCEDCRRAEERAEERRKNLFR